MSYPNALAAILVFLTGYVTGGMFLWIYLRWLFLTSPDHDGHLSMLRARAFRAFFHHSPGEYCAVVWAHVPFDDAANVEAMNRIASAVRRTVERERGGPTLPPFGSV